MVDIADTYADVTNTQAKSREDINRPSYEPSPAEREAARIAEIEQNPKHYVINELLEGSNREVAAKLRARAAYEAAQAAANDKKGKYRDRNISRDARSRAQALSKLAQEIEGRAAPIDYKTGARIYSGLFPGGIQAERAENVAAKALGMRKPNPRTRTYKTVEEEPTYEVTDAQGRKWRSKNPDFLEQKTGVDVRKVKENTLVLRDSATNKVYYGKVEDVRGKPTVLAVGKKSTSDPNSVSIKRLPGAAPGTTTQEYFQEGRLQGVLDAPRTPSLSVGDVGSNISQVPPGTDTSLKGDYFLPKIDERTGLPQGTYSEDTSKRRVSSAIREDYARAAFQEGNTGEGFRQGALAFSTGVFETGAAFVTNPVGFFIEPLLHPKATFDQIGEGLQTNPAGTLGQLSAASAIGGGIGKGVGKIAKANARTATAESLARAETRGTTYTYDNAGGYVEKYTDTTVKVGGQEYMIKAAAKETYGVGGGDGILTETARPALRLVQQSTGDAKSPYTAGQGRFSFVVSKNGKAVIEGVGETGTAAQESAGFDLYARTAKATVETQKGTTQQRAIEIGALKEGLYAEVKGDTIQGSGLVEGRSTTVTEQGVKTKNLVIEETSLTYEELTPSFLDDRSTGGSAYDIVGGEPRTVKRGKFLTRENTEPFNPSFNDPGELPPAFPEPKKPSESSGLVQTSKQTTKPTAALKLSQAEKQIISESIGKYIETTTPKVTPIGITTNKPLTESAVKQAVKPVTTEKITAKTIAKPRQEAAEKPAYKIVPIEKIRAAEEVSTAKRLASKSLLSQTQELGQAQRAAQELGTVQIAAQTPAQRASRALTPPFTPTPLTTPQAVALPRSQLTTKRQQKGTFDVSIKRRGVWGVISRVTDLKAAAKKGRAAVERSAAASVRVTDKRGKPASIGRFLPRSFRKSKSSPGAWVQPRRQRISSSGEKKDITAKGLWSLRGKKKTKGWLA